MQSARYMYNFNSFNTAGNGEVKYQLQFVLDMPLQKKKIDHVHVLIHPHPRAHIGANCR
jgi:hypothetical protein